MKKFDYEKIRKYIPRWLEITLGIVFLLLGIAGLVLPFLQGILFIFIGIIMISPYHGRKLVERFKRYAHELKERYRAKHPGKKKADSSDTQ